MRWGWSDRCAGKGPVGIAWLRPFSAAVPWLTVVLLLLMFHLIGGTFTSSHGILFDLPSGNPGEGAETKLVSLIMPSTRSTGRGNQETLVFFDDARYLLGDEGSERNFSLQLTGRANKTGNRTMLVLSDRRVRAGELMRYAELVKRSGVTRILFAERKEEPGEL